jgi:hypothetical protein
VSRGPTRRQLVLALAGAVAAVYSGAIPVPAAAAAEPLPGLDPSAAVLEAFADTMVPGEKRYPGDHTVAGAASGPGAVQAGAVELLCLPELGLAPMLPGLAKLLDGRATAYALARGRVLPPTRSAFVGLDFHDRTDLAATLLRPGAADQKVGVLLALFSSAAFDTAAHLHTTDALRQRHPGLAWIHFPPPQADGVWGFPQYSYRRRLAQAHPHTTSGGHPA